MRLTGWQVSGVTFEASRNTADQAASDTENVRLLLPHRSHRLIFCCAQYDEEIRVLTMIVGLQEKLLGLIQKRYDLVLPAKLSSLNKRQLVQSRGAQLELLTTYAIFKRTYSQPLPRRQPPF